MSAPPEAYRPDWLPIKYARDSQIKAGLSADEAAEAVVQAIRDQMASGHLITEAVFRLTGRPRLRHSGNRAWLQNPVIDWNASTILAPLSPRRIDSPTRIEVRAAALLNGLRPAGQTDVPISPGSARNGRVTAADRIRHQIAPMFSGGFPTKEALSNPALIKSIRECYPTIRETDATILRAVGRKKSNLV